MSASSEKRRRQSEREQGVEKRQMARREAEEKAKKSKTSWTIGTVLVVLLLAVIFVLNSSLPYKIPALTVGSKTYSAAEVKYLYSGMYRNLSAYGLVDTGTSLSEQECMYLEDGGTWDDYIKQNITDSLKEMQLLCDEAAAAGYTISEDGLASVQSNMDSLKDAAESNGMSLKKFVKQYYGDGVTTKVVEDMVTMSVLAQEYAQQIQDGFSYTDDELDSYFDEHIGEFKTYDYLYYLIKAEEPAEDDATEPADDAEVTPAPEDGENPDGEDDAASPEETEGTEGTDGETTEPELTPEMQEALTKANAMATYVSDEESFNEAVNAYAEGDAPQLASGVSASNVMTEWLTEEGREYGQAAVAAGEDGYYVIMYMGCEDQKYPEVSVRHILVKTEDADEDGSYSDEEKAAALQKAEDLMAEWEAGDKTEDSFAALANEKSEDAGSNTNGGLYENVYKGAMVEEFNDFCFAEGRKPGDTGIVHGNNGGYDGYHLMYFVGANGPQHSRTLAENAMVSADYEAWKTEAMEGVTVAEKSGMGLVKA